MKRIAIGMMACILIAVLLVGCGASATVGSTSVPTTEKEPQLISPPDIDTGIFTVYNVTKNDSSSEVEYDFADRVNHPIKKLPKEMTVTIRGQEVTGRGGNGQYDRLEATPYYIYSNVWDTGVDGRISMFAVNEDGKVLWYIYSYERADGTAGKISEEEAIAKARLCLDGLCDVTKYSVSVTDNAKSCRYIVIFQKKVNGLSTLDRAVISIGYNGEIQQFIGTRLGTLPDGLTLTPEDMNAAKESVMTRVAYDLEAYGVTSYFDKVECTVQEELPLHTLKDGSVGFVAYVTVDMYRTIEDGSLMFDHRENLTYLAIQ